MIKTVQLLYKLDYKLNKLATLTHQEIPLENKILALQEAQIKLVKTKVGPNNNYTLGFDAFKKRYEDLENLVEPPHLHRLLLKLVDENLNKWQADLSTIEDYMFYVDSYALANKGDCIDHIIYVNHDLTKHSDVSTLTANSNYIPSFEYQETFDTISSKKIELYTDGTFDFTYAYISYLRYPKKVDYPGYIKLDGTPSGLQDCEFHSFLEDELINFALLELGFITENKTVVDATQERIKTTE